MLKGSERQPTGGLPWVREWNSDNPIYAATVDRMPVVAFLLLRLVACFVQHCSKYSRNQAGLPVTQDVPIL
jgi:hypothetical protein